MINGTRGLRKIALVGNPNSGKSTVFNQLTGLRQKTGNFPGVTVDIKVGRLRFANGEEAELIDFPGTYSLYPTSSDEKMVAQVLADPASEFFPDAIVYVADMTKLEKHLLLFTQLLDLNLPMILVLNMSDAAADLGIKVNTARLTERFGVPVMSVSGRTGDNIQRLLGEIEKLDRQGADLRKPYYPFSELEKQVTEAVRLNLGVENSYRALQLAHHHSWLPFMSKTERGTVAAIVQTKNFQSLRGQVDETLDRYDHFLPVVQEAVQQPPAFPSTPTDRLDTVLTHRRWGPIIFFGVMLLIFQAIFDWSQYPMDAIEAGFGLMNDWLKTYLPAAWYTDLLTDGVLTGLSGIMVFVPQIALLFLLVTILEEVGYMARVVFMFDKSMRRFGMNGRSIVSLISGGACAVPAIMSSRTIGNWQERIITIMVTPFISCSARIPVYLVLIGLAVPNVKVAGIFSTQSLVFGGMYALGVVVAFLSGWAMKKWLHRREPSFLAIELPVYRLPQWRNVWLTVWEKVRAFVSGAGKIIIWVSIGLWALSSFGPNGAMQRAETSAINEATQRNTDTADLVAQHRLEASYAGQLGKFVEPAFRPLGYDWKISIALLTSFAAREVFTGTLAVLYNLGSAEGDINNRAENAAKTTLRTEMRKETYADDPTRPVYTLATALSLLVFYALAMQCFSTLAVVRRETGSWKWAIFQFFFMTGLAYLCAWAVYNIFS